MAETKVHTTENRDQPNPNSNPSSDPKADERLADMRGAVPADQPPPSTLGRPTPTQDELDRVVRGEKVTLEPDGSPEQLQHGAPVDDPRLGRRRAPDDDAPRGAAPPYEQPVPTQAHLDSIARGDHLRKGAKGPAGSLPEGAVVPEGMQHIPPEHQRKTSEPDGDKAAYRTRESHPDKQRRGGKKEDEQ